MNNVTELSSDSDDDNTSANILTTIKNKSHKLRDSLESDSTDSGTYSAEIKEKESQECYASTATKSNKYVKSSILSCERISDREDLKNIQSISQFHSNDFSQDQIDFILKKYSTDKQDEIQLTKAETSFISNLQESSKGTISNDLKNGISETISKTLETQEKVSLDSSDEELPHLSPLKLSEYNKADENVDLDILSIKYKEMVTKNIYERKRSFTEHSDNIVKEKRKKNSFTEKENVRLEREKAKAEKRMEKERLKTEAEKEKTQHRLILAMNKNMKPEECIKFLTVHIDPKIVNQNYGGEILSNLQMAGVAYKVEQQLLPGIITWQRKNQSQLLGENGQLTLPPENTEEDEVLLIMNWNEIVELVSKQALLSHIREIKSIYVKKRVTLGIYGLEAYYKFLKNQKRKQFRDEIREVTRTNNADKAYGAAAIVMRRELEDALTDIQVFCSCNHRMLETVQDLAQMVLQFTKAVAQIPYKLEKRIHQQQLEWFIAGDNKDCVHVDKNGNGLQRLWSQQLTTFPLARLETAEAIASRYATPSSLMQAYENCHSQMEGQQLLQSIPVRRAAGPLTNERKIGPELSKKIVVFFTSIDGNVVL